MTASSSQRTVPGRTVPIEPAIRLWQLISPTLPIGGYSYSQGLERVVETGQVADEASAAAWLGGLLRHGIGRVDLPILLRIHGARCVRSAARIRHWSEQLTALRETAELRLEDRSMGNALARLLPELGVEVDFLFDDLPFAAAFAIGAASAGVTAEEAGRGYAWVWCEQQVAAAVKLIPLGHTAGQRILCGLGAEIGAVVSAAAALTDEEIGASLPGFAIASAQHETQYTRLFRS